MPKFFKSAGILDTIKLHLAKDVWTPDQKLQPSVEKYILQRVHDLVGKNYYQLFVLGSITGYQYDADSDIDVNILMPEELITPELQVRRKETNGQLAPGTAHPVNLFVQPGDPNKPALWQDAAFGVYNILTKTWDSPPGDPSKIRNPKDDYVIELITAKHMLEQFKRLIIQWKDDKKKLQQMLQQPQSTMRDLLIEKKKAEIEEDFNDLLDYAYTLDQERKLEYDLGWGVPRVNWRNIIFKYFESSVYGGLFEELLDIKSKQMKVLRPDGSEPIFIPQR